jgi:hypothetical protein
MMLELAEIRGLGALLEEQEKSLLSTVKLDPVRGLRELRQKWDTLMTTSAPELVDQLGLRDAYKKFSIFYEGVTTVPESYEELKVGKMDYMLSAYVADYYDKKRLQVKAFRPPVKEEEEIPVAPVPVPPAVEMKKTEVPVGVMLGVAGVFGLLLLAMMRKA